MSYLRSHHFKALSLLSSSLFLFACSSGNMNQVDGMQCEENYAPVPLDMPIKSRRYAIKDAHNNMAPGTYLETSAIFYVVATSHPDRPRNLRVAVQDLRQNDGSYKAARTCIRNARAGLAGLAASVPGVNKITVDYNLGMTVTTKQYGFHVEPDGTFLPDATDNSATPQTPEQVYATAQESFFYRVNDFRYEVHSTGPWLDPKTGQVLGQYWLQVTLDRQP